MGVPLKVRVNVIRDEEAGVFIATSDDLRGLVCEAATMDELVKEVEIATDELLRLQIQPALTTRPVTDLRLCSA